MFEEKLIEETRKYIEKQVNKILTTDYFTLLNSAIISGFFYYGSTMTFITKTYKNAYNNFELVRTIDYSLTYSLKYLHSLCYLYTIEPYRLSWYSNCWIEKTSIQQFIFNEKISDYSDNGEYCIIEPTKDKWVVDPLFIGKIWQSGEDTVKYYCRRIDGRETEPKNAIISFFPVIPSDTHFLSITYKHPEMKNSIELTIDNGWFMEGNEILSASFVYRELEYQQKPFIFDKQYTLHMIDQNINFIEIGYYEYIEIKNDSYEIVNIM
jgi:hypothetical protein